MSNKSQGSSFEYEFSRLLGKKGYWVHRIQDNRNGQPFDIIACKNNEPYVFDWKVCSGKGFPLSRIEYNQSYAMDLFNARGNRNAFFAFRFVDEILVVSYLLLTAYGERGITNISLEKLREVDVWKQL